MKLKDCRDSYYYNSQKASDIARHLCFAGLAAIWAFRIDNGNGVIVPPNLRLAGILLLAGLVLDFLHYVVGTIVWGAFSRHKEKADTLPDEDFEAPPAINYPAIAFFAMKLVAVVIAYVLLMTSLFSGLWECHPAERPTQGPPKQGVSDSSLNRPLSMIKLEPSLRGRT